MINNAVDVNNNVLFYIFGAAITQYNSGNTSVLDTIYFAAYNSTTGADEVFGKVPLGGQGSSVLENELIKRPGSATDYYFIYKTNCTTLNPGSIRYVTINSVTHTVSAPVNLTTNERNGEGMAVSQIDCQTSNRWLFLTRAESNNNITLRRCQITNSGISAPSDIYTSTISNNSGLTLICSIEISPTNNSLAIAQFSTSQPAKDVILFDYNNSTGGVSNERYYDLTTAYPVVACEFSPDGSRLYIMQGGSLAYPCIVYNCPVSITNYTILSSDAVPGMTLQASALEVAYDGNLYVGPGPNASFIYCIQNPNSTTPTVVTLSNTFLGPNDRFSGSFPDEVDGEGVISGVNAQFLSTNATGCVGQTVNFNNTSTGASSWQWDFGDGNYSTSGNSSHTYSTAGTYTVSLIASASACASDTAYQVLTVNPQPTVSVTASSTNICQGQSVTLTASGGNSYQWSGGSSATTPSITVTPSVTTTYIVNASNGNCTSVPDTITVTVSPAPSPVITGQTTICSGQTTTLTATGGTSYQWSGGSSATTPSITVSPNVTTYYYVTATNGSCVSQPQQAIVYVLPQPVVNVGGNLVICAGETTTLTAPGGTTYLWSTNDTTSSISVSPLATTTYFVSAGNGYCYSAPQQVTVTVNSVGPTVYITGNSSICAGQSTTLTATGGTNYQWSGGSSATTQVITVSPSVTTTYYVTGDNGFCTGAPDSITVVVNPSPVAAVSGTSPVCRGDSAFLYGNGGGSYLWQPGNYTSQNLALVPMLTTTYSLIVTNSSRCSDTATFTMVVHPRPNVNAGNDLTICAGDSVAMNALVTGAQSYIWAPGPNCSDSHSLTTMVGVQTTTTFVLTANNQYDCSSTDTVVVYVQPCTGIQEQDADQVFSVVPNPSSGIITVNPANVTRIYTVRIFDAAGQLLFDKTDCQSALQIDLSVYSKGMFLVQLQTEEGVWSKRVLIQ